MEDLVDTAHDAAEDQDDWIISVAAVAIAIVATFMALCGVKADNVDYAIIQGQQSAVDQWAFYQSKSMKQYMFELQRDSFQVLLSGFADDMAPDARSGAAARLREYEANIERYEAEKSEIRAEAEKHEGECESLDRLANKLDLGEVFLSLAIALMAITILTKRKWLLVAALVPCFLGIGLGLAALMGLPFDVPLPGFLA